MKQIITFIALFLSLNTFAQNETPVKTNEMKATYVGTTNDVFYFKNIETNSIQVFAQVSNDIVATNKLDDKASIGKLFKLTYEIAPVEISSEVEQGDGMSVVKKKFQNVSKLLQAQEVFPMETVNAVGLRKD